MFTSKGIFFYYHKYNNITKLVNNDYFIIVELLELINYI